MIPRSSLTIVSDIEALKVNFDYFYLRGVPLTPDVKRTLLPRWQALNETLAPLVKELHEAELYEAREARMLVWAGYWKRFQKRQLDREVIIL